MGASKELERMADRFYIWSDGERGGPFSERQVERMLEDGLVAFDCECEDASTGERYLLDELFEIDADDGGEGAEAEGDGWVEDEQGDEAEEDEWEEDGESWDEDEEEGEPEEGEWDEDEEEEEPEEGEWDEDEEEEGEPEGDEWDEDWEDEGGAEKGERDGVAEASGVVYHGHPSLWHYSGGFLLALLGFVFGWGLGPRGIEYFACGFGLGVASLIAVLVARSTRDYVVTAKRVEITWGWLARSSQEVRIEDIRTINVRCRGVAGMFGIGTVEFSSTGDAIDVAFEQVAGARKVKRLVRDLQDALE